MVNAPLSDCLAASARKMAMQLVPACLTRQSDFMDAVNPRQRLCAYPPRVYQGLHSHQQPHVSVILAGSVREEGNGSEFSVRSGMFAVRPCGFQHRVRFGPSGALILSAAVDAKTLDRCKLDQTQNWKCAPDVLLKMMIGERPDAAGLDDALLDLIAHERSARAERPANWLVRARDQMVEEGASIAALACAAGVHRVHFSRAFTRAFGVPPSVYRRRMAALRAVAAAIDGRPAADSAYACGFADQSHMSRVLKRTTGQSFGRLQALRAKVTSVQS